MAEQDQPFQSVWTREEPRGRRRDQPALSREQIVAAALELLDTEGVEALSMRKLGTKLGAGATSLYTHVTNKEEIMELVTDAAFDEVPSPTPGPWRAGLMTLAKGLHATFMRHPWLATVVGEVGLLYLAPSMLRLNNDTLTLLEQSGFPDDEADITLTVLWAYCLGLAITDAASQQTIRRSGLTEEEWFRRISPAATAATAAYPVLHKRYAAFTAEAEQPTLDVQQIRMTAFEVQLDRMLDGLDPALRRTESPGIASAR
ncbi:TetR/AcrR family transcriptional regulator [Nocardia sp. NPDC057668]|uniref:TetR/AcrR family transcriptional regulator n=1 Tax=Nocardia sp. NPDC057668 TaxID=3346202 RepID=UPI00366B2B04